MRNLLRKELLLSMHPTAPIFLILSMMLIIPNYTYYVVFFYTGLAVFFTCLNGRENNDVFYTLTLPIAKKDIVKSRFAFVILLQLAQIIIAIPFAIIRQNMPVPGNKVGMNANITLFGISLIMLGLFNYIFFKIYYKDVNKVGTAFAKSTIAITIYIVIAETCVHALPFVRDYLNTKDPQYLAYKLIVLATGMIMYAFLTFVVYRKSVKAFEAFDL
ncbi:ABC-2 transporter permease [Clostridium sp. JS66]|uniref:ABC-2 transporter permease n=1 Tax=Clostridium sp. JS66 TaxID=3064705 RepID=UPI00298DEA4A|nr:ABC-2 transporter permease [Clostridium sp. JS66]WPC40099.1 ABC-2 transporter permease [Clostridium sp. JS66]